ncbi:MAG: class I SAM-dependent methyltransferase [Pseudomonadota bacterium]
MTISRQAFNKVYDARIVGRTFVEDLDYYRQSQERFWQAFRRIEALKLPEGARALDIGGGIMGVLMAELLGLAVTVADVNDRSRDDIEGLGLTFVTIDLFRDGAPPVTGMDLVVLQEVIEHIPQPPYIVFRRIARLLAPGGRFFLTTPNGHRFRNVLYMIAGKEILGLYRYPEEGQALGHQHEYTMKQLLWQTGHSKVFEVEEAEYFQDGWAGSTPAARLFWQLTKPAGLVPRLRNSIGMTLVRQPQS